MHYGLFSALSVALNLRASAVAVAFGLAALLAGMVTSSTLHGSQLVFAFEATISEVPSEFASLNLPFSLAVGQTLTAQYSFPAATDLFDLFNNSSLAKEGLISIDFAGFGATAPLNLGLVSDGAIFDPPIPQLGASLLLSYASPTNVVPAWGANIAGTRWNTNLSLAGAYGTIADLHQIMDVKVWNAFTTERRLKLQFAAFPAGQFQELNVIATLGPFTAVPEPSSATLIVAPIVMLVAHLIKARRASLRECAHCICR